MLWEKYLIGLITATVVLAGLVVWGLEEVGEREQVITGVWAAATGSQGNVIFVHLVMF